MTAKTKAETETMIGDDMSTTWEQEQAARKEANRKATAEFADLCGLVADALNKIDEVKDWELAPSKNEDGYWSTFRTLTSKSALQSIDLSLAEKGRIKMSGSYSLYADYGSIPYDARNAGHASVAVARGPEVIAKEITRRVLPFYRPMLVRAKENVLESKRRENEAEVTADAIADAIGEVRREYQGKRERLFYIKNLNGCDFMAHFQVREGGKVEIKMDVTRDAALKIIAALGFREEQSESD